MNDEMKKDENRIPIFVVEWESAIGRDVADTNTHPPVHMSFITTVRAVDKEAAQEQLLVYSDPTFTLKVKSIRQLGTELSQTALMELLVYKTVFNINEIKGGPVKAELT